MTIPTLGGRSVLNFEFDSRLIHVTNSSGRSKTFTWNELNAVQDYCEKVNFARKTKTYNPMDGGSFPAGYPKHMDTLSLVALVHNMLKK